MVYEAGGPGLHQRIPKQMLQWKGLTAQHDVDVSKGKASLIKPINALKWQQTQTCFASLQTQYIIIYIRACEQLHKAFSVKMLNILNHYSSAFVNAISNSY